MCDRKAPDYRNSIKESISAVEGMCQAINNDANATLGQAIKRLGEAGITHASDDCGSMVQALRVYERCKWHSSCLD